MIRGFESSRVLLVMDNVKMNNLIYRAGHLQNIITVDPSILERVEVLYGPSSVATVRCLGGVVAFRSKNPVLGDEGKTCFPVMPLCATVVRIKKPPVMWISISAANVLLH